MHITHIDIHLAGDGYVVVPAGAVLPGELARALGELRFGWSQEVGGAARLSAWRGIRADIDACGYAIISGDEFAALLAWPVESICRVDAGCRLAA
ncbi:hypothetical protein BGP89_08790 [Luteimonas sp. JM171]|uniref:hypothetical protein n=1 Tax=Luteimonas sp. JM171 TaxID=1896164 RepID=UPI000856ECCA|nr:hypothetical protein [Luteimonas sp. JM171]AOH36438.1 hypothetical protein BGP89_08790 [Luteimonas sp. JM171]